MQEMIESEVENALLNQPPTRPVDDVKWSFEVLRPIFRTSAVKYFLLEARLFSEAERDGRGHTVVTRTGQGARQKRDR
jgi:hypothetical protein